MLAHWARERIPERVVCIAVLRACFCTIHISNALGPC